MEMKIIKNEFILVSEIKPEEMRNYAIFDIGEKLIDKAYNFLRDLEKSYPNFSNWYHGKVVPELRNKSYEREIIIVSSEIENKVEDITPKKKYELTGIAILKKTRTEKKICAFRIHEDYRAQGIGKELFEQCFKFLDTREPVITISSDRIDIFRSFIEKYNFTEKERLKDYYIEGSTEYVYNGYLKN